MALAFPRILACEDGRQVTEYTLSVLAELGLPADRRAYVACHLLEQVVMTVTAESAASLVRVADEHTQLVKHQQLMALSPEQYPHLVPVLGLLVGDRDPCRPVSYADTGMEIFLAGISAFAVAPLTAAPAPE